GDLLRGRAGGAGQLEGLVRVHVRGAGGAPALLGAGGLGVRQREPLDDVVGHRAAAPGEAGEVADLPLVEDDEVGGAAAQLHQRHADVLLVVREGGQRGGDGLQHQLGYAVAGAVHRLADVLRGGGGA